MSPGRARRPPDRGPAVSRISQCTNDACEKWAQARGRTRQAATGGFENQRTLRGLRTPARTRGPTCNPDPLQSVWSGLFACSAFTHTHSDDTHRRQAGPAAHNGPRAYVWAQRICVICAICGRLHLRHPSLPGWPATHHGPRAYVWVERTYVWVERIRVICAICGRLHLRHPPPHLRHPSPRARAAAASTCGTRNGLVR
jgi:hypothetical protein